MVVEKKIFDPFSPWFFFVGWSYGKVNIFCINHWMIESLVDSLWAKIDFWLMNDQNSVVRSVKTRKKCQCLPHAEWWDEHAYWGLRHESARLLCMFCLLFRFPSSFNCACAIASALPDAHLFSIFNYNQTDRFYTNSTHSAMWLRWMLECYG